ncbi:hypothetical protein LPJ53_000274 [Coemansia erecta]|uniref:Uncharacterized protein n=1 Tax=Coemansia erecta TaxID=147472 RepID=A0A9W8CU19_9FUNG|nr:hypothetical protein LPJ53_000274 [Coemansia erecta]
MGSHSEMSDMDYADVYETKGRASPSERLADKGSQQQQLVTSGSSRLEETQRIASTSSSSSSSSAQSYIAAFDSTDQAPVARTTNNGQLNGGRDTQQQNAYRSGGDRRMSEEHAALQGAYGTSGHMAISTNRNMESLRQQSIIEREEEELEIASSLLTGMPRRNNRPLSMVPHIFLNPNTPAYAQQVRKTERVYAHARSMEHPLLESISRCVSLREQRIAMGVPRTQPRSWVSRRTLAEPGEADLQAEWWESLMPPPPSQQASARDQRAGIGSSGRSQPPELPYWISAPDATKCAVYGPDMATPGSGTTHAHEPFDPSCDHVRYLRERAKQLRLVRQQALSTGRNQTQQSTRSPTMQSSTSMATLDAWRGRRAPGQLGVDAYPGSARPMDVGGQGIQRQGIEPLASSSPDSIKLGRTNQLARPYRRFGTVYGCTTLNPAGANVDATGVPYAVAGGSGAGFGANLTGGAAVPMRGQDGILPARSAGINGWDNDPRRSSYFDRLSIDDQRPQISSSSNAQTTTGGFLRRVISGLAGGTAAAFGASQ